MADATPRRQTRRQPTRNGDVKAQKIMSLELALSEQHRDYDVLHSLHEALKTRILTFIAAAFGILGYLYSAGITNNSGHHISLKQRLFFPNQAYGEIFYIAGIILLLGSIAGLITATVKNRPWHTAFDNSQEKKLMNDYEEYLEYIHNRYLKVSSINGSCYESRRYLYVLSLYSLIIGGSILLVIKTFGG